MPGNTYQFVAVAQANHIGYQASLETPGFVLQTEMVPGLSRIEDYILKLDRNDDDYVDFGVVDYRDVYGNTETMMDTLWTTKPDEVQIVNIPRIEHEPSPVQLPDTVIDVTIPMMRITNSIKVSIKNPGFDENTSTDIYNVLIDFPKGNGTIDFTGKTYPAEELYYRALRKNMVKVSDGDTRADGESYAIYAEFGVSRLQVNDESSLQVRDSQTNEILSQIPDFSDFLAKYFAQGFDDPQEFLDREYDFEVGLETDLQFNIKYIDITLAILGWHIRVQYSDL